MADGPAHASGEKTIPLQLAEAAPPAAASTVTKTARGSRTIVGLMGTTVVFSLIGNEVSHAEGVSTGNATSIIAGGVTEGGKIILGGFAATAALVLISNAGDAGNAFAVGLATVAALTAALVYGGPVWRALSAILGSTPSKASTPAKPTKPTTPTTAL